MVEEIHNRLFRLGLRITSSSDHPMQMMLAATVERGATSTWTRRSE
jgi:DNA-binding MurR/RpiR family transcriptional regulator